jgi:hypothetical protein
VPPSKKLPITVEILRSIFANLDLASPCDLSFWAAFVVAFFGFMRKFTLLPESAVFVPAKTVHDLCIS